MTVTAPVTGGKRTSASHSEAALVVLFSLVLRVVYAAGTTLDSSFVFLTITLYYFSSGLKILVNTNRFKLRFTAPHNVVVYKYREVQILAGTHHGL